MTTRRSCRVVALAGSCCCCRGLRRAAAHPGRRRRRARAPPPAPAADRLRPPALPPRGLSPTRSRGPASSCCSDAQAVVGSGPRELIIDPLIDASTGQQTTGTVQMGAAARARLIKSRVPHWSVRPLTRGSLSSQPLLLIGTLTAINTKGVATRTPTPSASAWC